MILWKIFQNSVFFENFPIFCFLEIQNFGKFDRRFCLWKIRRIRKLRKNQKFVVLLWLHKRAQTCTNDAQTIDLSFNSNGSMRAEMELVCPQPPPQRDEKKIGCLLSIWSLASRSKIVVVQYFEITSRIPDNAIFEDVFNQTSHLTLISVNWNILVP